MLFNFGRLRTSDPNILDVLDSFCGRKNARLGVNGNPAYDLCHQLLPDYVRIPFLKDLPRYLSEAAENLCEMVKNVKFQTSKYHELLGLYPQTRPQRTLTLVII